jgi:hypothetical protein
LIEALIDILAYTEATQGESNHNATCHEFKAITRGLPSFALWTQTIVDAANGRTSQVTSLPRGAIHTHRHRHPSP